MKELWCSRLFQLRDDVDEDELHADVRELEHAVEANHVDECLDEVNGGEDGEEQVALEDQARDAGRERKDGARQAVAVKQVGRAGFRRPIGFCECKSQNINKKNPDGSETGRKQTFFPSIACMIHKTAAAGKEASNNKYQPLANNSSNAATCTTTNRSNNKKNHEKRPKKCPQKGGSQ